MNQRTVAMGFELTTHSKRTFSAPSTVPYCSGGKDVICGPTIIIFVKNINVCILYYKIHHC